MVASDTVVGLVGAGILLVALVGVFVYESRQGGLEAPELNDADYTLSGKGNVETRAQSGTALPGGTCNAAAGCTPASTVVNVEITGLPKIGSTLKYVVFLTGGGGTYNAGTLAPSGETWKLSKTDPVDQTARTTVVISLEKSATATSPGFPIITFPKGPVPANPADNWLGETGNHTLSLTASGSMLNVSATIDDVPDKSGYEYHGWMKTETADGTTYTHVGKFGHPADEDAHAMGKEDLVLARNVNGTAADYNEFWVTLEPTGSIPGAEPGGPPVIVAAYNKYEPSATEA